MKRARQQLRREVESKGTEEAQQPSAVKRARTSAAAAEEGMTTIRHLPPELLVHNIVIQSLQPHDLLSLSLTSKTFHSILQAPR